MKKEIIAAYAAGIFDGEGYVDIYKATQSKASKSISLMLRVIVSQKDGRLMNWLQDNYGGHVTLSRKDTHYIYRWDIRSKNAARFLEDILPYLQIKKDQALIALEFEKEKGRYLDTLKGKQGFRQLSDEEMNKRLELKEHLKALKKEYVPYVQVQRLNEETP